MKTVNRLFCVLFVTAGLLCALVIVVMSRSIRTAETRNLLAVAETRADHLAADVDAIIRGIGETIMLEVTSTAWRRAVAEGNEDFIASRLRILRDRVSVLASASFAEPKGTIRHSVRTSMMGRHAGTWARERSESEDPFMESSMGLAPDGYPVFTISAAIRDNRGAPLGYLGLDINVAVLGREILSREDEPFYVCILDGNGVAVAHSVPGRIFDKAPPLPAPSDRRPFVTSFVTGEDEAFYALSASMETVPWTLVYFIPASLIESRITALVTRFVVCVCVAFVLLIFILFFFGEILAFRPIARDIERLRIRPAGKIPADPTEKDLFVNLHGAIDGILEDFEASRRLLDAVSDVKDSVYSALPAVIALVGIDDVPTFLNDVPERLKPLADMLPFLISTRSCEAGTDPVSSVLCDLSSGKKSPVLKRGGITLPDDTVVDVTVSGAPLGSRNSDSFVLVLFDNAMIGSTGKIEFDFLSAVSHELRTPLGGIAGLAQLIKEDGLDADQAENMVRLEGAVRTMDRLIGDLQDYSRLVRNKSALRPEPILLADAAAFLKSAYVGRAEEKGLDFRLEAEGGDLFYGDRSRLMQIAGNLIDNAVKYTDSGAVGVSLQNAGYLLIIVNDTGVGIPEEEMENVFKAFSQLPDAQKSGTRRGLGLGLAIVEGLVRLWGGEITVSSKSGEGSTFAVRLPSLGPEQGR